MPSQCANTYERPKVLAVRHGQSEWNVLREIYSNPSEQYCEALYKPDCDVTELGAQQSRRAGLELKSQMNVQKEKVHMIVSPLRRALQTAQGILSQMDCSTGNLKVSVHPAATEVFRDACDIGSPVDHLEREFKSFNFDLVRPKGPFWWGDSKSSVEESWRRLKQGETETKEEVQARLNELREFIRQQRNDDLVILVCHSELIWSLSSKEGVDGDVYGVWTENGEVVDVTEHVLIPHKD